MTKLTLSALLTIILQLYLPCFAQAGTAEDLPVTSPFGWRTHPITGEYKFHTGLDLGYDCGAAIPALFQGLVIQAGDYDDGYGNQVLIFHGDFNIYTRYAHCYAVYVSPGDNVYTGQIIGAIGSTGVSNGPHLHLEYIVYQDGWQYADPMTLWGT